MFELAIRVVIWLVVPFVMIEINRVYGSNDPAIYFLAGYFSAVAYEELKSYVKSRKV